MGKATIYEHLGAGKYRILYTPEVAASDAKIAELEALKSALDAQLYSTNGLIEAKEAQQIVYDNASNAFFAALDAWAECARQLPACAEQKTLIAEVGKRGAARSEAGVALNTIKMAIADNRSKYFATTQEIAYLQNTKHTVSAVMEAWCIDLDPDAIIPASTVVGTIETYGAKGGYAGGYLPRPHINVQSSALPEYLADRDHCVKPISAMKTASLFFNWAQWLFVMSQNPQHAVGTVLSKFSESQDYLDVELFGNTPHTSQPGGYPFDGSSSIILLNVPVSYLTCGAELFSAGDYVVVRFSDINRANPTVIGFAENPRQCESSILQINATWPGGLTEIRRLSKTACSNDLTATTNPEGTTIGWLDWLDADGEPGLWISVSGPLGIYRYGKFISRNPAKRKIHVRRGTSITVASDIYGITKFNGNVYYVTKTSTHFEIRTNTETVIASIALSSIAAAMPSTTVETLSSNIIDGWLKFSTSGSSGATLLSTHKYLSITLSVVDGETSASFSIESAPIGNSFYKAEWVRTETIPGFCIYGAYNSWGGSTSVWALDYIGNELNFLYIDTYGESLSLPVATSTCTDVIACFYRKEGRTTTRYRIKPAGHSDFESSSDGVVFSNYELTHADHYLDWVPSMANTGSMTMADLDIRRKNAAFVGNVYSVTGSNAVHVSLSAALVCNGSTQWIHNANSAALTTVTLTSLGPGDGGWMHGGQELPYPCGLPFPNSNDPTDDATGGIEFAGIMRAEIFSLGVSDALFFTESDAESGGYVSHNYRYCGGWQNINSILDKRPTQFGYKST